MKKELLKINEMVKGDEIAESLTECLCEYPHFLWSGDVRYIDKVYVVIIF